MELEGVSSAQKKLMLLSRETLDGIHMTGLCVNVKLIIIKECPFINSEVFCGISQDHF